MTDYTSFTDEEIFEDFKNSLLTTGRAGMEDLVDYLLKQTDFFTAPASTAYHNNKRRGLVEHSLNVRDFLVRDLERGREDGELSMTDDVFMRCLESAIISALLHDVCKCNAYKVEFRNKKNLSGEWVKVPQYSFDRNRVTFGHGSASVIMAQEFIKLTPSEKMAIFYHMGDFEGIKDTSNAYRQSVLALRLHIADLEATYLAERDYNGEPLDVTPFRID